MPQQKQKYEPLTPLMCARLAAPHTWPGPAVLTTIFGGVFSMALGYPFSPGIWCLLLAVAIFAQSGSLQSSILIGFLSSLSRQVSQRESRAFSKYAFSAA